MNKIIYCLLKISLLLALLWSGTTSVIADDTAATSEHPHDIIRNGKFYADLRYRSENVDQSGIAKTATASTMRSRFGLITGEYRNFQASVELDSVGTIGTSRYNSTINGKTQFPVVADPHTNELNALWISWKGLSDTFVKVGRQPINLDNERFIGTVGFRQNDQTYDTAAVTNTGIDNLHLYYSFTNQVNRVVGHKAADGKLNSDIHMGRAEYEFLPNQKLIAYNYWLKFDSKSNLTAAQTTALSSKTYGLRLVGNAPVVEDVSFLYQLEGAQQHDNGNNPNDYSEYYYHVAPGIKWKSFTFEAAIESLGGNGTVGFSTPLSTLHRHNGWADKFLTTPGNGLQDRYLKATYKVSGVGKWVDDTMVQLFYHDFNAVRGDANYGTEWNVDVTRVFTSKDMMLPYMKQWSVGLRYADYDAQDFATDTRKGWFTLAARF